MPLWALLYSELYKVKPVLLPYPFPFSSFVIFPLFFRLRSLLISIFPFLSIYPGWRYHFDYSSRDRLSSRRVTDWRLYLCPHTVGKGVLLFFNTKLPSFISLHVSFLSSSYLQRRCVFFSSPAVPALLSSSVFLSILSIYHVSYCLG